MASSGKFDRVDFSQINIESLTPDLRQLGQGFRCVRGEFVTYWKQGRIQREADAHLCQCWIARVEDALAGYIRDSRENKVPIFLLRGAAPPPLSTKKLGS